jgi:hypothetical protein
MPTRKSRLEERPSRKTAKQLHVPVLPDEVVAIKEAAAAVGLTVAAYLRNLALGHKVTGILDHQRVLELARVNGDLGRLGGLLKLWLTDDEKIAQFESPQQLRGRIVTLLSRIGATQAELQAIMARVVRTC